MKSFNKSLFWNRCKSQCKKLLRILAYMTVFLAAVSVFSVRTMAADFYTADTFPNPRLNNVSYHVSDPDDLLTKETVSYLNEKLTVLEKGTGIQSAVVVLKSIGNGDVFEFSQSLFRKWGIGHKGKNDGLLVTYVEDQHVIRFHTGYGLEGMLPDAVCKRIQQTTMIPLFKEGKINEGMRSGIDAICKRIDSKEAPAEDAENSDDDDDFVITVITAFATVVLIFIIAAGVMIKSFFEKCPNCGRRRTLKKIKDKIIQKHHHSYLVETKRCTHCGYEVTHSYRIRDEDDDDHYSGGSSFSSGDSSGGSFGGGNSGGGGASSRW